MFITACLLPGAALLTRLSVQDGLERVALAVALSLCIEAAGALAMVWTRFWHPFGWAILLVLAASVVLTLDLARNLRAVRMGSDVEPSEPERPAGDPARCRASGLGQVRRRFAVVQLRALAPFLPAVLAVVTWRLSLLNIDVSRLGDYGLPPALPLAWYVALVVAVVGAVLAISLRRTNQVLMLTYVAIVALILFGTVPVLSAQPHYAWVYKHIGVVRLLEAHGRTSPSIDIYNRWPGFFALAAVFSTVAGQANPAAYAGWADFAFIFLDVLLLMAAVKAVACDARVAAGAGLLFIVTNWVGQTYYSPQAFASVLALALLAIALRQLGTPSTGRPPRLAKFLDRVGRRPQLPRQAPDPAGKWPRWVALTVVLGLDAVSVASHQLTPYMLLVSMALLMILRLIGPRWLLLAMAAMTFAYLAINFNFIQHNYGLFTSIDPFNNVQGPKVGSHPSAGKVFSTDAQLLSIAAVSLATLCATLRLLRQGLLLRALPFAVLAVSPLAIVFGQNYGGEASLRIVLFASPWCAALIAWAAATLRSPRATFVALTLVALVFTPLFVVAYLGEEELNIVSPAEERASERFYDSGRRGSVLVLAAPGFPYRYGASYPEFRGPEGDANPNLMTEGVFLERPLGAAQVADVAARIRVYSPYGYIAFSKDETAYAEAFRLTPPGALAHLREAVAASALFRLWYANRDVQIYELLPARGARSRPAATAVHPPSILLAPHLGRPTGHPLQAHGRAGRASRRRSRPSP